MRISILLVTVASLGFAPVPPHRPGKIPDLSALTGSWQMVRYQSGSTDSLRGREMRVTIDQNLWTFHIQEAGKAERTGSQYLMTVDLAAKPPQFSWFGKDGKTKQYVGSYKADKSIVSVVFTSTRNGSDQGRPTDFSHPRPQDYLIVMKRISRTP